MNLSEQEKIRREALDELRKIGINPYPAAEYKTNAFAQNILDNYSPGKNNFQEVCLAGRIMSRRIMGNASFAELMDSSGRIQIYVRRDDICKGEDKIMYNNVFKRLLDIGDIIGVKGHVFVTQMGETTVHVNEFTLLSKSVRPLPIVKEKDGVLFDAVTDTEMRYRQRYVDLIVNPHVRDVFRKRTQIIQSMRELFNSRGYLEVETPILQPIPGGAAARPFITHHNTLDMPLYLRVANELYLKRLIVGGFEGVYEFSKDFRNEGMDRTHNPEFTVMEIYIAYKDYNWMMTFTEEIVKKAALDLHEKTEIVYGDKVINLNPPFKRITMTDAIMENTGIDISGMDEAGLRSVCDKFDVPNSPSMGKGKLIDELFGTKCEHNYIQPTFIIDYPTETSPLTKMHRSKPGVTERFELMINGKEIANAYSELNDPIDQMERFQDQLRLSEKGDDEAMFIDMDFIRALEYGMPPTSGMGIGIDRLTMLLTNQPSIQDVLLFPQMKPESQKAKIEINKEEYLELGIPEEWIDPLKKLGFTTIAKLKEVEKAGKLATDLNGFNKKNKLGLSGLSPETVGTWLKIYNMLNLLKHPLLTHKLTLLRRKETGTKDFRETLEEIAGLMAYEITRDLPVKNITIETPLGKCNTEELAMDVVLVPVLRAGLGMVDGISNLIPTARIGHIGMYRDHVTLRPMTYYSKFPDNLPDAVVMVLDPMLATGGSSSDAIKILKNHGARTIKLVCVVGAPEGVERIIKDHPDVQIYLAGIDEKLNEHGYIVPGLGDAGDRLFGTK